MTATKVARRIHGHRLTRSNDRRILYRLIRLLWPWCFDSFISLTLYVQAFTRARIIGDTVAVGWLNLWILIVGTLCFARLGFRYLCGRHEKLRSMYDEFPERWRGLQYLMAGLLAGWFVGILAIRHFTRDLLWIAWPAFLPGIVIMVNRFSLDDQPGLFPRPVTRRAMVYAALSMSVLLIAATQMPTAGQDTFVSIMFLPLIAFSVLMSVYALMRRSDLDRLQSEMLKREYEQLIQKNDFAHFWPQVAQSIQSQFQYKRVIIIIPDENYHRALRSTTPAQREMYLAQVQFFIAGNAGEKCEQMELTTYSARGIARSVLADATSRIVPDVKDFGDEYFENGLHDTRAELYVPVVDLEHEDEVIAIVVLQDSNTNTFTYVDQTNVEIVADYLASFARHLSQSANYVRLQDATKTFETAKTLTELDLLNAARTVFGTDCIIYIPLAFATYFPLLSKASTPPGAFPEPFKVNPAWLDMRSGISELIRTWRPLLLTNFDQGNTASFWSEWATTNKLQALALVPVGARGGAGALFIIGFHRFIVSESNHVDTLIGAFANNLAPYIDLHWQQWWNYECAFLAPTVEMHHLLNRYSLDPGSVNTIISASTAGDGQALEKLCTNVKALVRSLHDMQAASSPLRREPEAFTCAVERFYTGLQGRYSSDSLKGIRLIDPRIEQESAELKTMLYRVICDAMLNSVGHGHANTINVLVWRQQDQIMVLVQDDGQGFDPATLLDREKHPLGLVALCRVLSDLTGAAPPNWLWTAPNRGVCLKLCVPCLAVDMKETPLDADIAQKLKRLEELYGEPTHC